MTCYRTQGRRVARTPELGVGSRASASPLRELAVELDVKWATVLLAIALAGCAASPPSGPVVAGESFSERERCTLRFPDNSTMKCIDESTPAVLGPLADYPICVARGELQAGIALSLRHDPVRRVYAIEVVTELDEWVAVLHAVGGSIDVLQRFDPAAVGSVVEVPAPADWEGEATIHFYRAPVAELEIEGKLTPAQASILWTTFEGRAWPVFDVKVNETSHFFHFYSTLETEYGTAHLPHGGVAAGADYNVTIDTKNLGSGSFGVFLRPTGLCTTG